MRKSRLKTDCDYYQEFGFKRKESTAQLRQDVERVRRQWRRRASLGGKDGEEASDSLSLLAWTLLSTKLCRFSRSDTRNDLPVGLFR